MARKALMIKSARAQMRALRLRADGKKVSYSTRLYHRCSKCGRNRGYIRQFDLCRICIREGANRGEILGVRKSSW